MPGICLTRHLVLADFQYTKMWTVMIIDSLNKHRKINDHQPVTAGPIQHEYNKILESRKKYDASPQKDKMHHFITAFTRLHKFSMVAYPVGMHDDHFRLDDESLENKILFTIPSFQKDFYGRGGSVVGDRFVFALLDW